MSSTKKKSSVISFPTRTHVCGRSGAGTSRTLLDRPRACSFSRYMLTNFCLTILGVFALLFGLMSQNHFVCNSYTQYHWASLISEKVIIE